MKVIYTHGHFECQCTFAERDTPKRAGFRWDDEVKKWWTPSAHIANRMWAFASPVAQKVISRSVLMYQEWKGEVAYPDGLRPLPFQIPGAIFSLSRNRSYIGADPGLGKTVMAALVANSLPRHHVVYICPPSLVLNVLEEFKRWLIYPAQIRYMIEGRFKTEIAPGAFGDLAELRIPQVTIVADSQIHELKGDIQHIARHHPNLLMFADEAHRFKTPESRRTQALLGNEKKKDPGLVYYAEKLVYLSGTPMPNRPMELYPILSRSAPEVIGHMSRFDFGRMYCGGKRGEFGWDFSGASNMKILAQNVMGKFMLRLKKADVLKELPPKVEELVFLHENLPPALAEVDAEILREHSPEDLMGHLGLKVKSGGMEHHVSTYRRKLGMVKAPLAAKFIKEILDETDENVLVFTWHIEVLAKLMELLAEFQPIGGEVPTQHRKAVEQEFQKDPTRRLFIGNMAAWGVGFTLTKATRVVIVEPSWVPADNEQASDRAHRIGQKDSVFVQYLVFKNSIDRAVMDTILRKRKVIQHV